MLYSRNTKIENIHFGVECDYYGISMEKMWETPGYHFSTLEDADAFARNLAWKLCKESGEEFSLYSPKRAEIYDDSLYSYVWYKYQGSTSEVTIWCFVEFKIEQEDGAYHQSDLYSHYISMDDYNSKEFQSMLREYRTERNKRVKDSRIEPEFEDTAMFGVIESLRMDIENGYIDPESASLVLEDYGYIDGALSNEDVLELCGLDPKDFPQYVTDSFQASDFERHAVLILRKSYPEVPFDIIQDYIELVGNESSDEEIVEGFAEYIA